ncbi:hypothetical protein C0J50_4052 [Silurus asotus]|uniref:Uncharacterized protein n=1 Tax=Silurus asotus TaxID=30991 RepID=A0AAD5FF44_SILAS|nr:hypothetical protein C0J50_4052 [Silurus asotus]
MMKKMKKSSYLPYWCESYAVSEALVETKRILQANRDSNASVKGAKKGGSKEKSAREGKDRYSWRSDLGAVPESREFRKYSELTTRSVDNVVEMKVFVNDREDTSAKANGCQYVGFQSYEIPKLFD